MNLELVQDGPNCFLSALWNLFELRGHEITQREVDDYYLNLVRETGREAQGIPSLCAFTKRFPLQDKYVASYKVLFNEDVPAYKRFDLPLIAHHTFKDKGVIVNLKTQPGEMFPINEKGQVYYKGEGVRSGKNAIHSVVLLGRGRPGSTWRFENSWKSLPKFIMRLDDMLALVSQVYSITFKDVT